MNDATFLPPAMIAALFSFALISSITPGPNNIMLATSGVNFGIRRTIPHMAGISAGLLLIMIACGLGLGTIVSAYPPVRRALMILGIVYTLWLSWKIASAGSLGGGDLPHPLRFPGAFAFQWINVKLWLMTITLAALYVRPGHTLADTALVTVILAMINVPAMLLWAGFGAGLRNLLQDPRRIRVFNLVMGLLLAATAIALLRM
ncbi:MAG TPA: LysE family translocator [Rhizomicrobium sp.]|nr:LysE family translocator [Rhizomicrobium sp.]